MKIFSFEVAQGHEWVQARGVWNQIHAAAGAPQVPSRGPFTVELVQIDDDGSPLTSADAPFFLYMLAFRESAWERAREYLQPWGEILPVDCPQTPLVAFNALRVVDALDEEHSRLGRLPDGRVIRIKDWAFYADRVPAEGIFRIPQDLDNVLCTERTAHHLQALDLSGLRLELLWSSDASTSRSRHDRPSPP